MHHVLRLVVLAGLFGLIVPQSSAQISRRIFDAPVVVVDEFHRIEHLLHIDDDGYPDALSWWWSSSAPQRNVVTGLLNTGEGDFTPVWTAEFPPASSGGFTEAASAVTDLDGDGKLDLVIAQGDVLKFFHLRGTDPPLEAWSYNLPAMVREVAAGDIDGDGHGDALVLLANGRLQRWTNRGPQNGYSMSVTSSVLLDTSLHSLRMGELTGDGLLDALLVSDDQVLIVPMAPAGGMGAAFGFSPLEPFSMPMPAIGDIDGDGDQDVIVFEGIAPGADRYHVLRRTAPDEFVLEPPVLGGPATELADLDGDGVLDGVCCGGGGYLPPHNSGPGLFHISIQEDGVFLPAFTLPSLGAVHIAGVADLDLDGDQDLVAGRVVYLAEGPITKDPYVRLAKEALFASDLDQDGDPDLDLAFGSMLVNDGTGAFQLGIPTSAAPPPGMHFVGPGYAGDFDGDGDEDLIVGMFDGSGFVSMRLLANQGGGHFVDAGDAAAPGLNWSLGDPGEFLPKYALVADADGDGDLDVTVRKWPDPEPSAEIWLNDGSGWFEGPYPVPRRWPLAYADFDEDGTQDMVCGFGPAGMRTKWEPGLGPGSFFWNDLNRWLGWFDLEQDGLCVLDFDGDGHLDIGTTHRTTVGTTWTYVYLNNQNPNNFHLFSAISLLPRAGILPPDIRYLAADLDDDGLEDLAITSVLHAHNAVAIHRRTAPTGSGSYELMPLQLFEPRFFADVDGDGDLDAIGDVIVKNITHRAHTVGARRQYGAGTPGTGGAIPVLGASGTFRAGETASLRITGGCGGAFMQLVIIDGHPGEPLWPEPGFALAKNERFRRLSLLLDGSQGAAGAGSFTLTFSVPASVAGTNVNYIAYIRDPEAQGGWSRTNGLTVQYP